MAVSFIKKFNGWRSYYKNGNEKFTAFYSIKKYGEYAKTLAEMSDATGKRYNNYILQYENYAIIKIVFRGKVYDVKIENEDIKKVENYKLRITAYNSNDKTYLYVRAVDKRKADGKYKYKQLTRIITDDYESNLIFFKSKDTLDYRKENLIKYAPGRNVGVLNG